MIERFLVMRVLYKNVLTNKFLMSREYRDAFRFRETSNPLEELFASTVERICRKDL